MIYYNYDPQQFDFNLITYYYQTDEYHYALNFLSLNSAYLYYKSTKMHDFGRICPSDSYE